MPSLRLETLFMRSMERGGATTNNPSPKLLIGLTNEKRRVISVVVRLISDLSWESGFALNIVDTKFVPYLPLAKDF